MILKHNLGQTRGQAQGRTLLGLTIALGMALPAAAPPHPALAMPTLSPDYPQGDLRLAMGHGATDHDDADHDDASHDGTDHEADRETGATTPTLPTESAVPLIPARHGDHFTVGFPQGWVITHSETSPLLKAQSPVEPSLTTEISWYSEAPGPVFAALLSDIQAQGHTVVRYDAIAMDDTTAVRLWLTDVPAPEPAHAFISVVGYGSATAVLVSRYETRSSDLDNLLSQIHESFRRGSPTATPEHHHP